MPEATIEVKIDKLIHSFLDRANTSTARDAQSLSSAVKELYACRELARADKEADWMTRLTEGGEGAPDLTPDFGIPENEDENE